ncbi:MAG: hypothetical protein OYL97_08450 [Candidatus Poribacteria bacterium]|nr:hypothetical protein [Candidatus Poribacteria bacterium]
MKIANRFLILLSLLFCSILAMNSAGAAELLRAIPLSQTAIQLHFDEELLPEDAENPKNYQIVPEVQLEYGLLDQRMNRTLLILKTPLDVGKTYQLAFQNSRTKITITLPPVNEITFGTGNSVTFSGKAQDTTLLVNKDRKTRNNNAGAEPNLLCDPTGSVFFVAFDLFDAFEDMGIRDPTQVLEAMISLQVQQFDTDTAQTVIFRRVLLPWKEGRGTSTRAEDNELTYNSALHRNLPWNKSPAQAMLAGIDGDNESDYNGSEDVAHRIDGTCEIQDAGKRYLFKSELLTDAVRFWVANPDYNYGYLFALRDGTSPVVFSSKEATDENLRPTLIIRYQTQPPIEIEAQE